MKLFPNESLLINNILHKKKTTTQPLNENIKLGHEENPRFTLSLTILKSEVGLKQRRGLLEK